MKNLIFTIKVTEQNLKPLEGFRVVIHHWGKQIKLAEALIKPSLTPTKIPFQIEDEDLGAVAKLSLQGPMHQSEHKIENFGHYESIRLTPDFSADFVFEDCARIKPVSNNKAIGLVPGPTANSGDIYWKNFSKNPPHAGLPVQLGCRKLTLNVVDEHGKRISGYRAQPRFFAQPPMVDAQDCPIDRATVFEVRQSNSPVDLWVWPVAKPGSVQLVRLRLFAGDQTVTVVVNSAEDCVPASGSIEIPAPQDMIPYDGTTTDASFALGTITSGWRNRAVFDHFKNYIGNNAQQIIADHNLPVGSRLGLLAFHAEDIGFFTASGVSHFKGNNWAGMVLPQEVGVPELVFGRKWIDKLLISYKP